MAIDGRLTSKENIYTNDLFVATTGNLASQTFTWNELYVGTQEGGKDIASLYLLIIKGLSRVIMYGQKGGLFNTTLNIHT